MTDLDWQRDLPRSLLAPDDCVVCFHNAHSNKVCTEMDGDGTFEAVCGCNDYTTEEERGKIIVPYFGKDLE